MMKKWHIRDRLTFVVCFFCAYIICFVIVNMIAARSWDVVAAIQGISSKACFTGGFVAIAMAVMDYGKMPMYWCKPKKKNNHGRL